jgi:threonine aldolase
MVLCMVKLLSFFNKDLAQNFKYIRKQSTQLASKMRFISAQFEALLSNDLWKRNAKHSNDMAQMLFDLVSEIPEVKVTQPVQVNSVFAILPKDIISKLQDKFHFYTWDESISEVRWMCSFDTTKEDVISFVETLKSLLK